MTITGDRHETRNYFFSGVVVEGDNFIIINFNLSMDNKASNHLENF